MKISFGILLCLCIYTAFSQKPILDVKSMEKWTTVNNGVISADGACVAYSISNQPMGSQTLIITSTKTDWKQEFIGGTGPVFYNGKTVFFNWKDSLRSLELKAGRFNSIAPVQEFNVVNDFLVYKPANSQNIIVRNLKSNKESKYENVSNYSIAPNNNTILLEAKSGDEMNLQVLNLATAQMKIIWSGKTGKPGRYSWNSNGNGLAFFVEEAKSSAKKYEVWYYQNDKDKTEVVATNEKAPQGFSSSSGFPQFNKNGEYVFINLQSNQTSAKPSGDLASLDVWSYTDNVLQSKQLTDAKAKVIYTTAVNLSHKSMFLLETGESIIGEGGDFILTRRQSENYEDWWNKEAAPDYYLLSLKDGAREDLNDVFSGGAASVQLSPSGKWIIWYDPEKKNYFSYETTTGITNNITSNAKTVWENEDDDHPQPSIVGIASWLPNDAGLLIRDSYDIWLVDQTAQKPPQNWTNGYGRKHDIQFSLLTGRSTFDKNSTTLLNAFSKVNKDRGVFEKRLLDVGDPKICSMAAFQYGSSMLEQDDLPAEYDAFQRAANSNTWLVKRMSATESPNYFSTTDFKSFRQLSDVQPQKDYNWYTSELHTWKSLDGTELKGILYKPENFDSKKKYPVIFYYYERRSDALNLYLYPKASDAPINIPLFVSKGYLVFSPDIHYKTGHPGESAFNSVVSAAKYLSKFNWVDTNRMGLQGHSFGGYETNYIVSRTNQFAAACSAAGPSDIISAYGSAVRGSFAIYLAERHQTRMGAGPWEIQELYMKNSPVFYSDQVSTPLLMMNNKSDHQVAFSQGLEFFTALRRLGKRAWMLQYDDGDHSVEQGKDAIDFHTRMMQFFDHYLKDSACPRWMLYGIPAKDKGVIDGLDLIKEKDPKTGKWVTPKEGGLLTDEEKKKVEALRHRKPVNVTIE